MSSQTETPDEIEPMMKDEELENMRNLDGWAVGEIVERRVDGRDLHVIDHGEAWVELFNGQGRAGTFRGVRFMAVWDGQYEEAYAYTGREVASGNEPCYFVDGWVEPSDPETRPEYPDTMGVTQ